MRKFLQRTLILVFVLTLFCSVQAQEIFDTTTVRVKAPTISWTYDSRQRDRGSSFSPNPRFTQFPITIEHDQSQGQERPVRLSSMELTVSVFPLYTWGGHWACQHEKSTTGFFSHKYGTTIWCRGETPQEGIEMITGGGPLGRLGVAWSVEEPQGMVPTPPITGPLDQRNTISGPNGWDWIRLEATFYAKLSGGGNWNDLSKWGVVLTQEPQTIAFVSVNTGYLPPGIYGISTTKLTSDGTKRGTHFYSVGWPREKIPVIHHLGWIVIRPDDPVKRSGFNLEEGTLGVVRQAYPHIPFDEFPIPIPE